LPVGFLGFRPDFYANHADSIGFRRCFFWLMALGLAISGKGQGIDEATGGQRVVEAMRLLPTDRLELDGRPDEAFWERIRPATGFLQQEPLEGAPATERTEVRVAYDDHNLYLGVMLYDSNPQGIKAFQRRRDAILNTDDRFLWILDTFEDGGNAYFFEINPAGLMGDGLLRIGQGISINLAWDGIWRAWVVQDT
jgi:hypothetical protein